MLICFLWNGTHGKDDLQSDAWLAGGLKAPGCLQTVSICENAMPQKSGGGAAEVNVFDLGYLRSEADTEGLRPGLAPTRIEPYARLYALPSAVPARAAISLSSSRASRLP
jgi:hypothetical protein